MTEIYVSKDSVKATDVICRRGAGANSHPGNMEFRNVISANKEKYDRIASREKEDFSRKIWNEMSREGVRFVREASDGSFLILDDEKCARKIFSALRDYRGGGSSSLAALPRPSKIAFTETTTEQVEMYKPKAKKPKLHWMQVAAAAEPVQTKDFDALANAAIKGVLDNQALNEALRKNWGSNYDKKRESFEENVITRYRAAARQKGMSAEDFSIHLLPVLIREAGGVNCTITKSAMTRLL